MPKLLIVDGHSQMNRSYYAIPNLNAPDGRPVNAVFGTLNTLLRVIKQENPDHIAFALDSSAPTFRHESYAEYKAGRRKMPDDLREQFPLLKEVLAEMGITVLEKPGFEADDIIGCMAKRSEENDMECRILSGDRDMMQLVTDAVHVLLTKKDELEEYDPAHVLERFQVDVNHIIDLKGLMGDSSDNIPGVPGVGEKTAVKLLMEYGDLENVLKNADGIKGKLGERLRENKDLAHMSKELATIQTNVPLDISMDQLAWTGSTAKTVDVFNRLGFKALIKRLPGAADQTAIPALHLNNNEDIETVVAADIEGLKAALKNIKERFALCVYIDRVEIATETHCVVAHLGGDLLNPGLIEADVFRALLPLLDSNLLRVYENMKDQFAVMGCQKDGFDLRVADYLLDPQRYDPPESALSALRRASDAEMALEETGMRRLYAEVEHPLTYVLMDMENEGFLLDIPALKTMGESYQRETQALQAAIYDLAGGAFNIQSPKQLGEVLFERLNLPAGKKTKTGYSTDVQVLQNLSDKHPVVDKVLEYRQVAKLNSTYIEGLLRLAKSDGRVHTRFEQASTATGRISSQEPNLQNIPVRTERGREIRRAFIAPEGRLLVDADYSQIELRVLAHMSGDEGMKAAFLSGLDIHAYTAAQVNGVPIEEVTGAMRSAAKAVNFGIVYGISDYGLAQNIGITRTQAADFIEKYFARYGRIKQFMEDIVERGKQDGYVTTLLGRRRYLPELKSGNYNTRNFGMRAAMNAPIQGTAADIIKIAMVRVPDALKKANLDAKLILQVHDELIIECAEDIAQKTSDVLKEEMEAAMELSVPLSVSVKCGRSWYDTK